MNKISPTIKKEVTEFLNSQALMNLATVSKKGDPHAVAVLFIFDEEFNFYFFTKDESKKFENIKDTGKVAFNISGAEDAQTIQASGKATVLDDPKKKIEIIKQLGEKGEKHMPESWLPVTEIKGTINVVKITPSWLRYANYGSHGKTDQNPFHEIISK